MLSHKVSMVSHKVALSHQVVLSWRAFGGVPTVVSQRAIVGCGLPQPWHKYAFGILAGLQDSGE